MIKENVANWTDITVPVGFSCGGVFEPMVIWLVLFHSRTDELLHQARLTTKDECDQQRVIREDSAPLGIRGSDMDYDILRRKCSTHVRKMVQNPDYVAQVTAGDHSDLRSEVLEVIHTYALQEADPLLRKAFELHAVLYFMKTLITFTEESQADLARQLPYDLEARYSWRTSRLLGRQLKYQMHRFQKELLRTVLTEFCSGLTGRDQKPKWPAFFCTTILLTLCMEDIQTSVDNFLAYETGRVDLNRLGARECYDIEENLPFARMFHATFKTLEMQETRGSSGTPFNPIWNLNDRDDSWTAETTDMIGQIRDVINRWSMTRMHTSYVQANHSKITKCKDYRRFKYSTMVDGS